MSVAPRHERPGLTVWAGLATPEECATLSAAVTAAGLESQTQQSGRVVTLPLAFHPLLAELAGRLAARCSAPGPGRFELVIAQAGAFQGLVTPPVGSALLDLSVASGGAIRFPGLEPSLHLPAEVGQAVCWSSDAIPTPFARAPVRRGTLVYLRWYGQPETHGTFVCLVDDETPETTTGLLRAACEERGLAYEERSPDQIDPRQPPLPEGTILYSPGTSAACALVEEQLFAPGVVTFYAGERGPASRIGMPDLSARLAGLPMPRSLWLRDRQPPEVLSEYAEWLGGFPVVLRSPGGEGGVGTMRADSVETLVGISDLLLSRGEILKMSTYVPDAMHWRCVVLGDAVLTAYKNPVRAGDFRSDPSGDIGDYNLEAPAAVAELAIAATRASGVEFAGVDVLTHPSGQVYLLECNFPCYFPVATDAAGVDVAGPMVDFLIEKSRRV